MQPSLFMKKTNNQSHNYLINFNYLTNKNQFQLITRDWLHPHTMHANHEHLILWYLSIWRSDLGIEHTLAIVRISRSFLWYAMNDLMHVMHLWFLGIRNGHFIHLPKLNYGCKIECLQQYILHHMFYSFTNLFNYSSFTLFNYFLFFLCYLFPKVKEKEIKKDRKSVV